MNAECLGKFLGISMGGSGLHDCVIVPVFGRTLRECYGNKDEVPGSVHGETRIFKCTTRKLGDFSQLAVDGHQIGDF